MLVSVSKCAHAKQSVQCCNFLLFFRDSWEYWKLWTLNGRKKRANDVRYTDCSMHFVVGDRKRREKANALRRQMDEKGEKLTKKGKKNTKIKFWGHKSDVPLRSSCTITITNFHSVCTAILNCDSCEFVVNVKKGRGHARKRENSERTTA